MKSIGKFSNLVVLDVSCDCDVVPPFSTLTKLREIVFSTTQPFGQKWCHSFGKEAPKSIKFVSLFLMTPNCAEILLQRMDLTVLKLKSRPYNFTDFCLNFPRQLKNPKYMFVHA
jgi:hypothetical protein